MVRLPPFASPGDVALVAERLACNEEERVRLPPSPFASVVSTASTRPLYGRGVGSTPAGGSCRRSSEGRAPERHSGEARSSRAVCFVGPWCRRQHGELQPRRSGFEPWRACCARSSRAGAARLPGVNGAHVRRRGSNPQCRPRTTTATYSTRLRAGVGRLPGRAPGQTRRSARSSRARSFGSVAQSFRSAMPRPQPFSYR